MRKRIFLIIIGVLFLVGLSPAYSDDMRKGPIVLVDKNCIDGEYILGPKEQFFRPDEFPSIQDLVSSYSSSNYMGFIYGVLERRYPTGKSIIEQAGGKPAVDRWLWGTPTSATSLLRQLGMVIHEVGHGLDKSTPENWYFISLDRNKNPLSFTVPGMHGKMTWSGSPQYSMERSLLLDDDQNYKRPPAQSSKITTSKEWGNGPYGCDKSYAETYLSGDPTNSSFEGGDQGYNSLIEEFTQYVNSLAYAYYFQDYDLERASSDRHAMYTWMWWNTRYLRKIRNKHPEQYNYLFANKKWLELVLTLWGRAWLYLSTDLPGMQPDSDYLHQLVQQQEMLEEIQRIRDACDCDNPVELLPDQVTIHEKMTGNDRLRSINHYNYPNPFTSGTAISLNVSSVQDVTIDIFNCRGGSVKNLFNGKVDRGHHILNWDGTNSNGVTCARGVYFYRISTLGVQSKGTMLKQ